MKTVNMSNLWFALNFVIDRKMTATTLRKSK